MTSDDGVKHVGHVRLFMSVDLVGSTAFKGTYRPKAPKALRDAEPSHSKASPARPKLGPLGPAWANVFVQFYGFHQYFSRTYKGTELDASLRPRVVKAIGDELLLETQIRSHRDALKVVRHFAHAMTDYWKTNLKKHRLNLKGAAWIAGFPNTNHQVTLDAANGAQEDFIGPSIDTGFRISKFATPSKLMVTVDLALLMLHNEQCQLYCDGFESLKGVLDGRPYPVLWYPVVTEEDKLEDLSRRILGKDLPKQNDLKEYCTEFIKAAQQWLCIPYFHAHEDEFFNDVPEEHQKQYDLDSERDERNELEGNEPTTTDSFELPDVPLEPTEPIA